MFFEYFITILKCELNNKNEKKNNAMTKRWFKPCQNKKLTHNRLI